MAKRKPENYIDNKEFLKALIQYKKEVRKAKREDLPIPGVTNYIGKCFLDIATNLARKPNFVNYIFKEDMISDGVENCLMYVNNFDPKKSKNPFAFFTQIIFYSFLRRIQKEKKHLYTKMAYFREMDYRKEFANWAVENKVVEADAKDPYLEFFNLNENDLKNFDKTTKKKVNKKKVVTGKDNLGNFLA
jgi:hypothetical protein